MPVIVIETRIEASAEVVFDLSRSIDLHVKSTAKTSETAVAGCTSGLIGLGQDVTWEATHFGIRQQRKTTITEYDRPRHFRDSMISGAFSRFDHDHCFESQDGATVMKDVFDYASPLGLLGRFADLLFLKRYMTKLLQLRNELIKSVAESGDAQAFLEQQAAKD